MKTIEFDKADLESLETPEFLAKLKKSDTELEQELEEEFSNYSSAEYVFPTNNITSALHLAMCAISLKRGDKVICSVNSSPEVPEVVRHFDAEPIFIDIEPDTFKIDVEQLKKVLNENQTKKLKGIIVSHISGEILDLKEIKEIVKDRNLKIVEDATNSLGLDREELDTISDIRVFSFDNLISNCGIFATDNKRIFEKAKLVSNHGIVVEEHSHLNYIYDVTSIGCQYTAPKMNLIYSIDSLEKVSSVLSIRKKIAKKYIEALQGTPHIVVEDYNDNHSYSQFIIKVDKNRDGFAKKLKDAGIETKLHYIPLHLLSYYKSKYSLKISSFVNALRNYQQILSIPIHPFLSDKDINYIITNIKQIAEERI